MDLRVFEDIERTISSIKDGSLKPPIRLLFSVEVTRADLLTAAAQIIMELESGKESPERLKVKLLISPPVDPDRVPAPAVGEVLSSYPTSREGKK